MMSMNGSIPDHTGHENTSTMDHMMSSGHMGVIHFGHQETIVFGGWTTNDVGTFIGSLIGLFFIALIFEFIKFLRASFLKKNYFAKLRRASSTKYNLSNNDSSKTQRMAKERKIVYYNKILNSAHLLQTTFYFMQVLIAYFLMLAFMTYNFWICLSILLGKIILNYYIC